MKYIYRSNLHHQQDFYKFISGKRFPVITVILAALLYCISKLGLPGFVVSSLIVLAVVSDTLYFTLNYRKPLSCFFIRMLRHDQRFQCTTRMLLALMIVEAKLSVRALLCKTITIEELRTILFSVKAIQKHEKSMIGRFELQGQEPPELGNTKLLKLTSAELRKLKKRFIDHITVAFDCDQVCDILPETKPFDGRQSPFTRVEISNLIIVGSGGLNLDLGGGDFKIENYYMRDSKTQKLVGPTDAIFKKCVFIGNEEEGIFPNYDFYIIKDQISLLKFDNCFFSGGDVSILQLTGSNGGTVFPYSIELNNIKFIPYHDSTSLSIKFAFDPRLRKKCVIDKEGDFQDADLSKIRIACSFIANLDIVGVTHLELLKRNVIDQFSINIGLKKFAKVKNRFRKVILEETPASQFSIPRGMLETREFKNPSELMYPVIAWGPYQKIKPEKTGDQYPKARERADWITHKKLLNDLKKYSERKEDHVQTAILDREIMICDHQLLRYEGVNSWQDRIALCFSNVVSNYGISWTRPIAWLTLANFVYAGLIAYVLCNDIYSLQTLKIAVLAFNPLADFDFSRRSVDAQFVLLSALAIFQKVVLALMIYEIVRAARRYTRFSESSRRQK